MRASYYLIVALVLASAFGCQTPLHVQRKPDAQSLNGAKRVLEVNRTCKHPHAGLPQDKLEEPDYTKVADGTSYDILFSGDGRTVRIIMDSKTVEGVLASDGAGVRMYELGKGLFAGGRFVVWAVNTGYEAELTIYGSGEPIIQSERGALASDR